MKLWIKRKNCLVVPKQVIKLRDFFKLLAYEEFLTVLNKRKTEQLQELTQKLSESQTELDRLNNVLDQFTHQMELVYEYLA